MPESGTYGSGRGAVGNHRSYRNRVFGLVIVYPEG
jgi:hypothetical protein